MRAGFLGLIFCSLAAGQSPGERLYLEHCGPCHGAAGYDGFAANLAVPRLPHAPDDAALARLIKNGFEGTDMPPAFGVTDAEVRQIVTYVRSLGRSAQQSVPGDARRGEQLYAGKGKCANCHMLAGKGGRQGPDLSDIGARRSAAHLRQSLTDPEAALPHDFLTIRVRTRQGRSLDGIRLNEDSFSLQMRDLAGELHSFWTSDLADVRKEWGKSPMPSYRDVFSKTELDDLIAFLASLRGDL
jgi:cytochrome c oxidase cbb3-type subunit 3